MKSSSGSDSDYTTVWSAPPKKPSGRTKFRETRHPVYRGVRRRGTLNRWVCEVRSPGGKSRIWLGTFPTAEMAARAHDVAVMALRGRSACLNFADSAWLISIPPIFSSAEVIKQAAIEAAEALHPHPRDSAENGSSSASSAEMVEEKEMASSWMPEPKTNSATEDQTMEVGWDANGEMMNMGVYYASLAEGLMMEPPVHFFGDLDGDKWGVPVSLWS